MARDSGDAGWLKLAPATALPKGQSVALDVDGQSLALFHTDLGFHAIDGYCLHAAGPLAEGDVLDETVTCPWHGWCYRLDTGQRLDRKGQPLNVYRVKIHDEWLWLELPDPARS